MQLSLLFTFVFLSFFIISCSTIGKKDCDKDMFQLGMDHGKNGSAIKYTDELRQVCMPRNPSIDLEKYEKGFMQGWIVYCLPNRGFEMGKKGETYVSFCPVERESLFREKYLMGKKLYEMLDIEVEMSERIDELKSQGSESVSDKEELHRLEKELANLKREMQALELEGKKDTFKFR